MKKILFDFKQTRLSQKKLFFEAKKLEIYRKKLLQMVKQENDLEPESSLHLPYNQKISPIIRNILKEKKTADFKYFIFIGIGGTNLGVKAIYEALRGTYTYLLPNQIQMFFLDTLNPISCNQIISFLKTKRSSEFIIQLACSSGQTTEVIANFETIYHELSQHFQQINKRLIILTKKESPLFNEAQKKDITCFTIPSIIPDRYSVFSLMSLLPLAFCGIPIHLLQKGARQAIENGLAKEIKNNPALLSAALTFSFYQLGISQQTIFLFDTNLESLGKWQRQLMAESLGKEKSKRGKKIPVGITPLVCLGSTDLHSMFQLFMAGPKNTLTHFIFPKKISPEIKLPSHLFFKDVIKDLAGKTHEEIMQAIFMGTMLAYQKHKRPFLFIQLPEINAESLGYYLQFRMIETMFLAHLLQVNAFNQPNVEDYKKEVRKILKENK
jgi:glucose-6-phosphate isomerase